ncbi:MAG: RHS repeat protein [Desulfobacteraceae bacterium]|nr:RHS repeat protein [Desulfobacteraceae bacterium]
MRKILCWKPLFVVIFFVFLISCGGGGGSGDGSRIESDGSEGAETAPVRTGCFGGGPVSGLVYETATRSGETDQDGEFSYLDEETIRFYIGDILIGEAPGASTISPFDLVGLTPPISGIDVWKAVNRIYRDTAPTELEQVINIAVFLQTLDDDGDAANGIRIPAALHGLAGGMSIVFEQPHEEFMNDIQLRKLMAVGRATALWGGSRAIRNPYLALDGLYAGLGLTPVIHALYQESFDAGMDGIVEIRITFAYDADGNKIGLNNHQTWAYDANGNNILHEKDTDYDGFMDKREDWIYDGDGNKTLYELDENGDGIIEKRIAYAYDLFGNMIVEATDNDADGILDHIRNTSYDEECHRTRLEVDDDADGTVDLRWTWSYDADGNNIQNEKDNNADGLMDERIINAFDANGNHMLMEFDNDGDGAADQFGVYTYDGNGRIIRREFDRLADGSVDSTRTFTYDASGNLTCYEKDNDNDGTADEIHTFTYDANSLMTYIGRDTDGDGDVSRPEFFTYDADGNQILREMPIGTFDRTFVAMGLWTIPFEFGKKLNEYGVDY